MNVGYLEIVTFNNTDKSILFFDKDFLINIWRFFIMHNERICVMKQAFIKIKELIYIFSN